jgi:transcriptional regulator with XRE-family HTH domain
MSDVQKPALRELGRIVAESRVKLGLSQEKVAELVGHSNRSEIAYLEEGQRLPKPDKLERICECLHINPDLWKCATHPKFLVAMDFQELLGELLGKPLTLDHLDIVGRLAAVNSIGELLALKCSPAQAFAHFNSILTFYGEKYVSREFFNNILTEEAFAGIDSFRAKVREFQKIGLRLYGNFRRCWKALSFTSDFAESTKALKPISTAEFTERREFDAILSIENDGLDDLGYISVERAQREALERDELAKKLRQVALRIREDGTAGLVQLPPRLIPRLRSLLKAYDSRVELDTDPSLFATVNPQELEDEAARLAPREDRLQKIDIHRSQGMRNLTAYLTEPYMDVYVATSMRSHADYVSVNNFVETIFSDPAIKVLKLRYFNPTQSFISDRVAKGLVEALMLRRSRLTVYMAQKTDTFGKDSEASVALGQGKPVLVYVPKIQDDDNDLDSERIFSLEEALLNQAHEQLGLDEDDTLPRKEKIRRIIRHRLENLPPVDFSRIVRTIWADFDLYGEVIALPDVVRKAAKKYLDDLLSSANGPVPLAESTVCAAFAERIALVSLLYEERAQMFRESHPLALQVIVDSGVLNGILVVRSPKMCAQVMYRLITNTIETKVVVDNSNFRLVEVITGSTLRVVSKYNLLTYAFWTQYFADDDGHFEVAPRNR